MKNQIIKFIIFFSAFLYISVNCISKEDKDISRRYQEPNPPYPYLEEEIKFKNNKDGSQLAGTLTIPNSNEELTAVILISGSGLQDRDETTFNHKPFKVLADYLTRNNITVLRYDDRGAGQSIGPMDNITPENFAEDAYAGLQYLKSRDDLKISKIGLIGHSMGAVEGSILASRYSDIIFLVMLGGPGIPLAEHMLKSDSVSNFRSGKSLDEIMAGQNLLRSMITEVKRGYNSSITEININRIIDEWRASLPAQVKEAIEEFTKVRPNHWQEMSSEWSTPYYRYILNYDPRTVLKKISCPVLSLIGEKDVQTLPEENSHAIKNALKDSKCKNYRVEVIKNLNHLFQNCETGVVSEYAQIEETFNVSAMEIISTWIKEQTQ